MRALQLVLFLVLLAIVLYWLLWPRAVAARRAQAPAIADELVKDPVCQTYVVRSRALSRPGPGGGPVYFCGPECARRYAPEARG